MESLKGIADSVAVSVEATGMTPEMWFGPLEKKKSRPLDPNSGSIFMMILLDEMKDSIMIRAKQFIVEFLIFKYWFKYFDFHNFRRFFQSPKVAKRGCPGD